MTKKRRGLVSTKFDPADRPAMSDAPTDTDRQRIQRARRRSRAMLTKIEAARAAAVTAAFRAKLTACIRSASPLLISLLAADGLTPEGALALIVPDEIRHGRSPRPLFNRAAVGHLLRYYMSGISPSLISPPSMYEHKIRRSNGDFVAIQVVDHALELEARIGPLWLETRFGELRVQLDEAVPETIAASCIGRKLEEIVDHPAWRGRGWLIVDVEDAVTSYFGQTMIVAAGSVPYRLTWADAGQSVLTRP